MAKAVLSVSILAASLTACNVEQPSEQQLRSAILESYRERAPMPNWQVSDVKKFDCTDAGQGRIRCRYSYRIGIQTPDTAKEESKLVERFGERWRIVQN